MAVVGFCRHLGRNATMLTVTFVAFVTIVLFVRSGTPSRPLATETELTQNYFHSPAKKVVSGEAARDQGTIPRRLHLDDSVVNAVKKCVFFVNHERSCHSFVGSLLDAHPHMVLATTYNPLLEHFSDPSSFPSKSTFFNKLSKFAQFHGVRYRALDQKGYSLVVDDKYQGVFEDHLDVIGLQRGTPASVLYSKYPGEMDKLMHHIREVVGIPVHIIRVIRNPYDIIATAAGYHELGDQKFVELKSSLAVNNITNKIVPKSLNNYTLDYFKLLKGSERAIAAGDKFRDVYCDELIGNPEKVIRNLCKFLQVECYEDYVNNAVSKVFKSQSATRKVVHWPKDILEFIEKESSKYPFLRRYIETGVE